jgi:hypothetical protein
MLNAFHKNKDDLAKSEPGFHTDGEGFRRPAGAGINANPTFRYTRASARFLKEHKA